MLPIKEIEVEQPVRKELRLFVEAVQNGTPPPIPGPEGKRNVVIAEAAYESARTNRPSAWRVPLARRNALQARATRAAQSKSAAGLRLVG